MMNTVRIREQMGLRLVEDREEEKTEAEARAELLMGRLCSAAGYGRALITNGPGRAMCRAFALARAYGKGKNGADCAGILVLTRRASDLRPANAEGCTRAEPGDPAVFAKVREGTVCAVVFSFWEPGYEPLPQDYVKELFYLCRSAGVLLISDERALGLGRTGSLLAGECYGKLPDLTVTRMKGDLGVCLVRPGLAAVSEEEESEAGACGKAVEALEELLAPGALAAAADKGRYLKGALSRLPGAGKVQGLGSALSVTLAGETALELAGRTLPAMEMAAREDGVLLTPDPNADKGELARGLALLRQLLEEK